MVIHGKLVIQNFKHTLQQYTILVWHKTCCARLSNLAWLIILLFCLSLYHTRMLTQRLQKWWIENPSLLTCVKTIQYDAIFEVMLIFLRFLNLSMSCVFVTGFHDTQKWIKEVWTWPWLRVLLLGILMLHKMTKLWS